jgi:nicotinamide-nucleotide amidase
MPGEVGHDIPDSRNLHELAESLLGLLDTAAMTIATAESCTGGFLSSVLTDIEGLSHCVDRGFVTYSKVAKAEMLGIDTAMIDAEGAVSEDVARAMAENCLARAGSDLALAITGLAGAPDPEEREGAGVIYVAAAIREQSWVYRVDYGERTRSEVRNLATAAALSIGMRALAIAGAR